MNLRISYLSVLNNSDSLLRREKSKMWEADAAAISVVNEPSDLVLFVLQQGLVADTHNPTHVLVCVLVRVEHAWTRIFGVSIMFSHNYRILIFLARLCTPLLFDLLVA